MKPVVLAPHHLGSLLFAGLTVFLTAPASAQQRDFTQAFNNIVRGDFTRTGNSVMTCDRTRESAAQCDDIEKTTGTTVSETNPVSNNNNTYTRWIDIDSDPLTYNSSSGKISIPANATVTWAGLYWTTNLKTAGQLTNTAATMRDRVLLDLPGGGYSYLPQVGDWCSTITQYSTCFKDVTSLVQSVGSGSDLDFTVANVAANTGQDDFIGGWELMVVYEAPTLPYRSLTIFHGFKPYGGGDSSTFNVSGFLTPLTGPIKADLGISITEGDKGSADTASFKGTNVSNAVSTAADAGDGSIGTATGFLPGRTPAYRNTLGLDVDTYNVSSQVNNAETSAQITLNAGSGEGNQFYKVDFAVDVYFPQITTTKVAQDLNGGDLVEGDELKYTVTVTNDASAFDDAVSVVLTDMIPARTSYKPGSMAVVTTSAMGPAVGPLTDAPNDDAGEYDAVADQLFISLGRGATPLEGGTLKPGDSMVVSFSVTVDSISSAEQAVTISNEALVSFEGATLKTSGASNPATSRSEDPISGGPTVTPADDDPDGDGLGRSDRDKDDDGLPDILELGGVDATRDSDMDGIPDWRDADSAGFIDTNLDGVDDRYDLDLDGFPNHRDLDADGDGVFDVVESGSADFDANNDGRIDRGPDVNSNGIIDSVDPGVGGVAPANPNTDGDAFADFLDTDDDDDATLTINEPGDADMSGIADRLEPCTPNANALSCPTGDPDGDMVPNDTDPAPSDPCIPNPNALACPTGDTDADTLTNAQEALIGTDPANPDTDGDGVRDDVEVGPDLDMPANTDGDSLIDALDPDDDGDGILTRDEDLDMDGDPRNDDTDMDSLPNYLDTDDDGDNVLTRLEDVDGDGDPRNDDSNMDGTPDYLDPCDPDPATPRCGGALDTDGDGLSDELEGIIGTDPANPDSDGDGLRDGVEVGPNTSFPRDSDGDGLIDALDPDDDNDSVLTRHEDRDLNGDPRNDDSDMDGIPDYLDPDDDNDGILTRNEDLDMDGDPRNDDTDMDSLPNYLDADDDGDSVLTRHEDRDGDGDPRNDNSDATTGDMLPDYLDPDDDGDGVLTRLEDVNGNGDPRDDDTNMNGFANYLDPCEPDDMALACAEGDTDGDGVKNVDDPDPLDPCNPDPQHVLCPTGDTDGDNLTNSVERELGTNPTNPDTDGDGVPDDVEVGDINDPTDTDGDSVIDALDPDDDGDGILTRDEDLDGDGDPRNDDSDMDTIPDYLDEDDDNDGILTRDEDPNMSGDPRDDDTDGDSIPNYLDRDDDGDGIFTDFEDVDGDGDPRNDDTDRDGLPNYLDADDDGDRIPTAMESADPNADGDPADALDSNGNGVPDYLDPAASSLTISSPADGTRVSPALTIRGKADPNESVEVFVDGVSVGTTTADEEGDWSLDVVLEVGERALTAMGSSGSKAGPNVVTVSEGIVEEVTITTPTNNQTLDNTTFTISGTATPMATVEVYIDGELVGTTASDAQGNWSLEVTTDNGPHVIEANVGDATSGVITVTVNDDSGGGQLAVGITSPGEGESVASTPTFAGTATAGATVEVSVDGEVLGTVVAGEDGMWSYVVETPLAEGAHTLTATATLDGESASAGPINFVVDASVTAPNDTEFILVGGGCAQSGATPAGGSLWLGLLGLLAWRRRRKAA